MIYWDVRLIDLREIRNSKVARQFDTSEIETVLKHFIGDVRKEIDNTKKQIENVKVITFEVFLRIIKIC